MALPARGGRLRAGLAVMLRARALSIAAEKDLGAPARPCAARWFSPGHPVIQSIQGEEIAHRSNYTHASKYVSVDFP